MERTNVCMAYDVPAGGARVRAAGLAHSPRKSIIFPYAISKVYRYETKKLSWQRLRRGRFETTSPQQARKIGLLGCTHAPTQVCTGLSRMRGLKTGITIVLNTSADDDGAFTGQLKTPVGCRSSLLCHRPKSSPCVTRPRRGLSALSFGQFLALVCCLFFSLLPQYLPSAS